jgi:hypothetical protein
MRPRAADVRAFGVVARIAEVSAVFPRGSLQRSHVPANANNSVMMQFKKVRPSATTPVTDGLGGDGLLIGASRHPKLLLNEP